MVDPFQLATQGVGPGWSTFSMATQGFGFEVEVIIRPSGGGGYAPDIWYPAGEYEVIVRIKYKDKTWEQRKKVSALSARSLEKVLASFKRIKGTVVDIAIQFNKILKREIRVSIFRK